MAGMRAQSCGPHFTPVDAWGSIRPDSPADMKAVMRESSPELERNEVERPLSCGVSTVRARAVSGRSVSS